MTRSRTIPFAEFRRFLKGLGFKVGRAEKAWVFRHPTEGRLILRLYDEDEAVSDRDLRITRTFLDMWGLLEGEDFDAFVQRATTSA
jgi:hypothetical protein